MVGRCIPYWNGHFLVDMLVLRGVKDTSNRSKHKLGAQHKISLSHKKRALLISIVLVVFHRDPYNDLLKIPTSLGNWIPYIIWPTRGPFVISQFISKSFTTLNLEIPSVKPLMFCQETVHHAFHCHQNACAACPWPQWSTQKKHHGAKVNHSVRAIGRRCIVFSSIP